MKAIKQGTFAFLSIHKKVSSFIFKFIAALGLLFSPLAALAISWSLPGSDSDGTFTVSWTGGRTYTVVQEQREGSSSWSSIGSANGTAGSMQLTRSNGIYFYRLQDCLVTGSRYGTTTSCSYTSTKSILISTTPPNVPAGFTVPATVTTSSFTISWTAQPGVTGHVLDEQINSGSFTTIHGGFTGTSVTMSKPTGTYSYRLRACNPAGCSANTAARTVSVYREAPTSVPGSLTVPATDTDGAYSISWSSVSGATTYIVQEKIGSGSWSTIQNTSALSKSFSGNGNQSYSYQVAACNPHSCTAYTAPKTVDVAIAPGVPTSISVPATHAGNFTVSWGTASGSVTQYDLDRSVNGASYTDDYDGTGLSFPYSNLAAATYTFRVRACATVGSYTNCSGWRTSANSVAAAPSGIPGSFTVPVRDDNGAYSISWTTITNTSTYELQEKIGSGSWTTIQNTSATNRSISGNTNNTYSYRVRACNDLGCGAFTTEQAVDVAITPGVPASISAPALHQGNFSVSWGTASGSVTQYDLDQSKDGGSYTNAYDGTATSKAFTGLADGTYVYRVRACRTTGSYTSCSGWRTSSNSVALSIPAAPTLTAPASNTSGNYSITWTNISNATSYKWSQGIGSTWGNETTTTSTSANISVFEDGAYQYRVRACNASGCSAYSSVQTTNVAIAPVIDTPPTPQLASIPAPSSTIDQARTLPGEFSVTPGGQATYSVPVMTAPGTAGLVPQVSLTYSSGGGNGIAGLGWSLSAYGAISRCRQTDGQDKNATAITWSARDRFCLNGDRLLVTSGTYGAPGSTYKTEIDSFSRITAVGGSTGHPSYFKVEHKNGIIEYYGNSTDSKFQLSSSNSNTVLSWAINRREDSAGNPIVFTYDNDTSDQRIATIQYAYGSSSSAYSAHIAFEYEPRPDPQRGYVAGYQTASTQRLTEITSYNNNQVIREYKITYNQSSAATTNDKLSRINELKECVGSVCSIATEFEWEIPDYSLSSSAISMTFDGGISAHAFGDINGDGLTDIAWLGKAEREGPLASYEFKARPARYALGHIDSTGNFSFVKTTFSDGTFISGNHKGRQIQLIDIDGDGRSDLVVSDGDSKGPIPERMEETIYFSRPQNNGSWKISKSDTHMRVLGKVGSSVSLDINADGLVDQLYWDTGGNNLPWDTEINSRYPEYGAPTTMFAAARLNLQRNGTFTTKPLLHFIENLAFMPELPAERQYQPAGNYVNDIANAPVNRLLGNMGDFNGDGRSDLVAEVYRVHPRCVYDDVEGVAECDPGITAFGEEIMTVELSSSGVYELRHLPALGVFNSKWSFIRDLNGDGLSDILAGSGSSGWAIKINNGKQIFAPESIGVAHLQYATEYQGNTEAQLEDINQDGYPDFIWHQVGSNQNSGTGEIRVRYWNPALNNFDPAYTVLTTASYLVYSDYGWGTVNTSYPGARLDVLTRFKTTEINVQDFNGDGIPDLAVTPTIQSGTLSLNLGSNGDKQANKIVSIKHGAGRETRIQYEPLSRTDNYARIVGVNQGTQTKQVCKEIYDDYAQPHCWDVTTAAATSAAFYDRFFNPWAYLSTEEQSLKPVTPVLEALGSMQVVTRVDQSSPSGSPDIDAWQQVDNEAVVSTSYFYEQMKMQAGGRGSLGFKRVTAFNHVSGVRSTTEYRQDWPFIGRPRANYVYARSGALMSEEHIYWGFADCYDVNGNVIANCVSTKATTLTNQGSAALGPVKVLPRESVKTTYSLESEGVTQSALISETETKTLNDNFGNAIKVEEVIKGSDEFGNEETVLTKTTISQYEYNTATWSTQNGRLQNLKVTTYNDSYGTLERESSFTYYYSGTNVGLLHTETLEPNIATYKRTTTHTYDSFGNRTQSSIVAEGQTRRSKVAFDSKGRYEDKVYKYLTNGANPASGTEVLSSGVISRDKFGTPTEVRTHVDGDSYIRTLVTTTTLGTPYFTADSTGTYAVTNIGTGTDPHNICSSHAQTWKQVSHAGGGKELVCFDLASRPIREASLSFDGSDWSLVDTEYDSLGRELRKSVPYFKSDGLPVGMWNQSLNYDELNRPRILLSPAREQDGESPQTTVEFTGSRKIITNHKNQKRTEIVNALGQIVKVVDPIDGETEFAYDSRGNMRLMEDPDDNQTEVIYDLRDRKISMIDPDKGTWQYRYNAFDGLKCQQDAKGQTITQTYDAVGRIFSRTDRKAGGTCESPSGAVENYTQWVYDTAANGWGQLSAEWSSDTVGGAQKFNRSYSYDGFGRPSQTATTFANHQGNMETHYEKVTYDQFGRVFQTFDAARQGQDFTKDGVKNVYNSAGFLAAVVNAEGRSGVYESYYEVQEVDARGNVTRAIYGNGVEQINTFWADNGLARTNIAATVLAEHLQNISYEWDAINNLENRIETGGGTWAHMYARERNIEENFTYDDLNRLRTYITSGDFVANESVTYDAIDNIRSKTGKGNYSYGSECVQSAGPHAVCQISGTQNLSFIYDSNGNLTSDTGGRALSYTVFDKPREITKGTHKTEFLYGPDRARYQRKDIQGSNVITTAYIGGVEKIYYSSTNTREWKRTVAGVARITRKFTSAGSATNEIHYLHYDHLGSISLITDDIGFAVEDFYFDPWGQSRKPADTVPTNNTGSWVLATPFLKADAPITSRGFTGHEMLDEVGLIHMNGRIYDASIGRFVQADPLIQDPLRVQSLNRYSYVWNNPLNATDPTGFATKCEELSNGERRCTSDRGAEVNTGTDTCSSGNCQNYKTSEGPVSINREDRKAFEQEVADGSLSGGKTKYVEFSGTAFSSSGTPSNWNSVEYAKNIDYSKEPSGRWVNPDSDLPFVSEDGSDRCWMGSSPNCHEVLRETHAPRGVDWGNIGHEAMRLLEGIPVEGQALSLTKFAVAAIAAKRVSLTTDLVLLAEKNITGSGKTVLGHFPGYIDKAMAKGASYFDIGKTWNSLDEAQRWAANKHFLDKIADVGDKVLLSLPKTDIKAGSYLAREVEYLVKEKGYKWVNQWSLSPGGG